MYIYNYRMTSTTATLLMISPMSREIVIGVRSDNAHEYPNYDSLPGGFLEARYEKEAESHKMHYARKATDAIFDAKYDSDEYSKGEDGPDCAIREAFEETHVVIDRDQLVLFDVKANPRTDARAHVTNICYYVVLTEEQANSLEAGDDIKEIKMLSFDEIENYDGEMAFNHAEIMKKGFKAYKKDVLCEKFLKENFV